MERPIEVMSRDRGIRWLLRGMFSNMRVGCITEGEKYSTKRMGEIWFSESFLQPRWESRDRVIFGTELEAYGVPVTPETTGFKMENPAPTSPRSESWYEVVGFVGSR